MRPSPLPGGEVPSKRWHHLENALSHFERVVASWIKSYRSLPMKILPVIIGCLTIGLTPVLQAGDLKPGQPPKADSPDEVKKDYAAVKGAKLFSIGGIGIAGTKSGEEVAFRKVVAAPGALTRCRSLIKEGTPEGRLYGLLGLKLLDGKAYEAAAPAFQKDDAKVQSAGGCIMYQTTVAGVAKNIADGKLK
jgi:hypothetical protein